MRVALIAACVLLAGCYDFSEQGFCRANPDQCHLSLVTVTPDIGPARSARAVTLWGTGFDLDLRVLLDGQELKKRSLGPGRVEVVLPGRPAGTVDLEVQEGDQHAVLKDAFRFVAAPALDQVTPVEFPLAGGTRGELTGHDLLENPQLWIGDTPATVLPEQSTPERLVFLSPPLPGNVRTRIVLRTTGGEASLPVVAGPIWSPAGNGITGDIRALGHLNLSPTLGVFFATTDSGIYRSVEGSNTWTLIDPAQLPDLSGLLWMPGDSRLVAATSGGLRSSTDEGLTWSAAADPEPVAALGWDPSDGSRLLGIRAGELWATSDLGDTWTLASTGEAGAPPGGISFINHGTELAVATDTQLLGWRPQSTPWVLTDFRATLLASSGDLLMFGDGDQAGLYGYPSNSARILSTPHVRAFAPMASGGWLLGTDGDVLQQAPYDDHVLSMGNGLPQAPVLAVLSIQGTDYASVQGHGLYQTHIGGFPR